VEHRFEDHIALYLTKPEDNVSARSKQNGKNSFDIENKHIVAVYKKHT
jgi:hypothetical protein